MLHSLLHSNTDDDAKNDFLAMLAHELRNPLATILSSVELVKLQETYTQEALVLLQTIEERVRFITSVLDDLLTVSQITPEKKSPLFFSKVESTKNTLDMHHGKKPPYDSGVVFRTVLVVDDNVVAAKVLSRLLELRGHTVIVAHNGTDAVHKAFKHRPEIILLDIGLPDINGYEVARMMQKEKDYTPMLIALTGYGQLHDKERALETGFRMHLTKPVGLRDIELAFQHAPSGPSGAPQ